ncbi:DUF3050 domain-containing protein [Acidipila sp. EB88]|uniref:DUF3050 domain-containing protein n=1 Tax=Acidipila sp. EB88 TaxID=2305226 RepID=UPI000F5D5B57|nr:DUF3050 domain-containing protein [Acidipila sp. EB88]RRA47594.1 DUF3050 domain-containing protein [Acidipila sp. EB88]
MTQSAFPPVASCPGETLLMEAIAPLQTLLAQHPLYGSIRSLQKLQLFMESHVFAVWDFMSLLKSLQNSLTCVTVPWVPSADPASRRLINEIVLGEESDTYQGKAISHFELYLAAMESCGADTQPMRSALRALSNGQTVPAALAAAPLEARDFVASTFAVLTHGATHQVAAAFTFGREDLIPDMFSAFVRELDATLPGRIAPFRYYLERHIEMDGDEHGPMALQMIRQLCTTAWHWEEATEAALGALRARLFFWDGIHARIQAEEGSAAGSFPKQYKPGRG